MAATTSIRPSDLLRAGPVERDLLLRALEAAQVHQRRYIETLARQIIHELAEALKRGR